MTTLKTVKASLNTLANKNNKTYKKGGITQFSCHIEVVRLYIEGKYIGTTYEYNNTPCTRDQMKEWIKGYKMSHLRRSTLVF